MKRSMTFILLFLLIIGALTGCGSDQEKIQKDFMVILDQSASEESLKEASEYLDKYISKMDKEYATDMVISLEHYILGFDQDGIIYSEWAEHYQQYISSALMGLYKIRAKEQASPMVEDAVLKISWEELLQRTYELELFMQKNKEHELIKNDATWIYENYMIVLFMGTNGTPIFDYKTHAFSEEAKTAYAAFINKYPDSITTWALTEYFTYLNSIAFTMDYNDKISSKLFFDTCDWWVSESGKRVFQ